MRMIDGEKRYFSQSVSNLFRLDDEARQYKIKVDGAQVSSLIRFAFVTPGRSLLKQTLGEPVMPVRMKLNYTITVKPNAVPEGKTIRCWMPFPREGHDRQKISGS